jgi:hypothetical protein
MHVFITEAPLGLWVATIKTFDTSGTQLDRHVPFQAVPPLVLCSTAFATPKAYPGSRPFQVL